MTIFLGIWQLQRLDWKNRLITEFNELKDQKPLSLSMGKMKYPNIDEFTKVITLGTVDRSKKIFFPAKTLNGKNGFRLASVLNTEEGENILVDEGWYPEENHKYFLRNAMVFSKAVVSAYSFCLCFCYRFCKVCLQQAFVVL